jgi:hypothetical protein
MANSTTPCSKKTKIDAEADSAIAVVDNLLKTPQGQTLNLELTKVKTSLQTIKSDPHRL